MKICFLEGDMSRRGGTERMTSILANALSENHDIYILSLKMSDTNIFFPLNSNIQFKVIPEGAIISQIKWIHKLTKQHEFDVIINVDIGMGFYGILATVGKNTKVITWEHGNFYNNWGSKIFPIFRRFAAKFSDAIVVLTEKDKENYCTNIKMKKPIYVIANPINRQEYTYDVSSKIILSAGSLVPIKRYDRVIEVAKKVLDKHPGWKWVICGEGPERDKLEALIKKAELENRVLLLGSIKDMGVQYKEASMFVLTSDMEGLPMVLLEAKSWGLPLVSFDIMTGPSDIIKDGVNGYLIEPYDIDVMAEQIGKLIDNRELREMFSENAQYDMDKFEIPYILSQWENVLGS